MKTILLAVVTLLSYCNIGYCNLPNNNPSQEVTSAEWVKQHFARNKIPPFSFVYGGKNSDEFITQWQFESKKLPISEPSVEKSIFTYRDPGTGLLVACEVTCYKDFQAVEWVLRFTNSGTSNTPVLENCAAMNYAFRTEANGDITFHHSRGSNAERSDFQPIDEPLSPGKNFYLTPSGGRSSDNTALPFFNLEFPENNGIVVAVGWTGKWYAKVSRRDEANVQLQAGMEKMQLLLYPKEEIRTPRICLLFWHGEERFTGNNRFRQFILSHHSRKIDGNFAEYPLSGSFDYGDPAPCGEYNCLTEEYAIALIKRYQQFKILPELFWLDAGWYTGCGWDKEKGEWWQNVGNWSVDRERFPHGLKPISEAAHQVGSKFMVWFEPERVRTGTQLDKEHPEWLIRLPGKEDRLFDLGNKEARVWLTNHISKLLKEEGIDFYRQDFNFDPMPYWDASNQPNRIGIPEIRHIEGLYAYWDSLLVRFPKLLIDNCASGGRRIDLETTSRSAPLWRTDYQYGEPNGYQSHTFGLNLYLPIHGTAIYKTDSYTFRSGLGATAVLNWEVTGKESESIFSIQKRISDYKNLRPYFYGDYYPLTASKSSTKDNAWLAYQLNRPQLGDGIILAFRRKDCLDESITVKLGGIEDEAIYDLLFEDYNLTVQKSGSDLKNGLVMSIPEKSSSLLIKYHKH